MADARTSLIRPAWRILLLGDGAETDLTDDISQHLISMTITDQRGLESDTLDIELDDPENLIEIPPSGARLSVSIGWHGQPLVNKGIYTVDEPSYSSPPRKLSLRARAADVSGELGEKHDRSWHEVKLSAIAGSIADRHGLTLRISDQVADIEYPHQDQTGESDISFVSRLAENIDALCTIKSGYLMISPAAACTAISGTNLDAYLLRENQCSSWRWNDPERDKKTAVRAFWHDTDAAERKSVTVGTSVGGIQTLRTTFASEDEAKRAAEAELKRLQRGGELSVTLSLGAPELTPETPVTARGFKPKIDDTPWAVKQVTHSLNSSGFTSSVEMEMRDEE